MKYGKLPVSKYGIYQSPNINGVYQISLIVLEELVVQTIYAFQLFALRNVCGV